MFIELEVEPAFGLGSALPMVRSLYPLTSFSRLLPLLPLLLLDPFEIHFLLQGVLCPGTPPSVNPPYWVQRLPLTVSLCTRGRSAYEDCCRSDAGNCDRSGGDWRRNWPYDSMSS